MNYQLEEILDNRGKPSGTPGTPILTFLLQILEQKSNRITYLVTDK